jgi:uncharacterized protein (DUF4415 family)
MTKKPLPLKTTTVSYTLTLPPLTEAEIARRKAFIAPPAPQIALSDVREKIGKDRKNAERGGLYRPVKRQITARVDADVLAWLKSQGKGYQSRINAILRREMLAAHRSAANK